VFPSESGRDAFSAAFVDEYCSTVQGLLDWFEVDLGFTELSFIQIDSCVLCVFFGEWARGIQHCAWRKISLQKVGCSM